MPHTFPPRADGQTIYAAILNDVQAAITDIDTNGTEHLPRLDQLVAPTAAVALNSQKITGLGTPTVATDAATKAYADGISSGLDVKASVRLATTANITLSGAQTIDQVSAIAGDRVLVKNQSTGSANGIYVVASGAWTRATDADISAEVTTGMFTFVESGVVNGAKGFLLITVAPITLDTTALVFTQFSGASGGGGSGTGVATAGIDLVTQGWVAGSSGAAAANLTLLQGLIDAQSAGARFVLPPGVSYFGGAGTRLKLKSKIEIEGAGREYTELVYMGDTNAITALYADRTDEVAGGTLRKFTLRHGGTGTGHGLYFNAWRYGIVEDVRVRDFGGSGAFCEYNAQGSWSDRWENCEFIQNNEHGFRSEDNTNAHLLLGTHASRNKLDGFNCEKAQGVMFPMCQAEGNGRHGYHLRGCRMVDLTGAYLEHLDPQTLSPSLRPSGYATQSPRYGVFITRATDNTRTLLVTLGNAYLSGNDNGSTSITDAVVYAEHCNHIDLGSAMMEAVNGGRNIQIQPTVDRVTYGEVQVERYQEIQSGTNLSNYLLGKYDFQSSGPISFDYRGAVGRKEGFQNLARNGGFDFWPTSPGAPPEWTSLGGTLTREASTEDGGYRAVITNVGTDASGIRMTIDGPLAAAIGEVGVVTVSFLAIVPTANVRGEATIAIIPQNAAGTNQAGGYYWPSRGLAESATEIQYVLSAWVPTTTKKIVIEFYASQGGTTNTDVLKVDRVMVVAGELPKAFAPRHSHEIGTGLLTKAGVPADADFGFVPRDGTQVLDTASDTVYVRSDGSWVAPSGGGGGATTLDGLTDVAIASRTVGDILRPNSGNTGWVDVADGFLFAKADFGATGDGTTDDLTALQNAINAAAAAKKVLVIEPGTYKTTDQLAAVSNLTIWAYGAVGLVYDTDLGLDDAFVPWLGIRSVDNVTVRGLEIDGRQASWAHSEWKHGIMVVNSTDVRIEDCYIYGCKGDGIIFTAENAATQRNVRGWVQNCHCVNNYRGGFTVTEGQTLKFKGCVATGHIGTSPMFGMDIEPDQTYAVCKDISIEDCDFSDNGAAGDGAGFYVVMKPNEAHTATSGTSTTFTKTGAGWITNVWAGATLRMISGNANNDNHERLIISNTATTLTTQATPTFPNAIASGNVGWIIPNQRDVRMLNTRMARNVIHGAIIYDCHDFLMDGCQIEYNGNAGLELKREVRNMRIVNNTFRMNVNDGLRIGDSNATGYTQKDIVIQGNWFQGGNLFNAGIEMQTGNTAENIIIDGNTFENYLYALDFNVGTVTGLKLGMNFIRRCTNRSRGLNRNNTIPHDVLALTLDGGGSAIAVSSYDEVVAPYDLVILGWDFFGTPSGSITGDIWSDTYANYPPVVADTITAADKPLITTAVKGQDLAPTGWLQHVLKGNIIRLNADSVTTTTLAKLYLFVARVG